MPRQAQGIHRHRGFITIGNAADPADARAAGVNKLIEYSKRTTRGCMEWQKWRHSDGYGGISFQRRNWRAHKLMYTLIHGQVPAGMVVMHTCDNPPCINPNHLKLGTKADNNRDMARKGRGKYQKATHCKNGHEFTPENTYRCKLGFRHCNRCQLIKCRLALGWTREQAETIPVQSPGCRPVGGSYKNRGRMSKQPREYSMKGSSPRMRAYRARKKAAKLAIST